MKRYILLLFIFIKVSTPCFSQQKKGTIRDNTVKDFLPVINSPGPSIEVRDKLFTIAVLPDTQHYLSYLFDGTPEIFKSQIEWIKKNQKKENIAYVAHLGDLTQNGDASSREWELAKEIMYELENPVSIPYGIAVGNHDQHPFNYAVKGTTNYYNKYFGTKHFEGRPYYGGHFGNNNDSHFDLFSAGGLNFIVVYIEYDSNNENQENMNTWAYNLLNKYSSRKAIIVSHHLLSNNSEEGTNEGDPGKFSSQGKTIYERLKKCPNLMMMLCGHISGNGEGYRTDFYRGNIVHTFLSDYQSRGKGGMGLMRLYRFSIEENKLEVKTYSPWLDTYETDGDSQFNIKLFEQS